MPLFGEPVGPLRQTDDNGRATTAADNQVRTSFAGIEFPVAQHTVNGTGRHHVHEYPHSPGGAPEKLGRALYRVTCRALFHNTFRAYPNLYPNDMVTLRHYYEQQSTGDFVHPSIGTFPAFIVRWQQVKNARVRSGETVDIEFLEDQQGSFNVASSVDTATAAIDDAAARLKQELANVKSQIVVSRRDQSIFDAVQSAANVVLGLRDTAQMYGNLYGARIEELGNLCAQMDQLVPMQSAPAYPAVQALHDLWQAQAKIAANLQAKRATLKQYTVPQTMSLLAVAITLYGDASRQPDLLVLNAAVIADAQHVPAGTVINYYAVS